MLSRGSRRGPCRHANGGDLLSFGRVGMVTRTYMDAGAFSCLGVGVPYAIAAALAFPGRQMISVNGDGAFGFNAMEIDTSVRHGARAVFIVSNNAAWNIERYDQERALANAPAVIDVVTSQSAVSSDARKGLGFVPDSRRGRRGTTRRCGGASKRTDRAQAAAQ